MTRFAKTCGWTIAAVTVFAGISAVQAQTILVADEISVREGPYRGAYAAVPVRRPPPPGDAVALEPQGVTTVLRADGFTPLGPPLRRGWIYTVAVINREGDDGRLVVDARTGEPIRFIPAMAVDARLNEELDVMYGPPGPPPPAFAREAPRANAQAPVPAPPKVANRSSRYGPYPSPERGSKSARLPASAQQPVQQASAPSAAPPIQASKPNASKPAVKDEATSSEKAASQTVAQSAASPAPPTNAADVKTEAPKPAPPEAKATQELPPVQPLE